ncbi:RAD55 family ATPase [Methanolobus profundi]|uniref:RecA-superfamily ATPase, KaiC/GvpD/RAD55 family n=1 Tax=Methanolobus profundi TaxID=487685 RepID=A0A1I4SCZ1_9EURY|nr:ATPase domain-containing protein [Methanolobus profundi]SFM62358.1 RecA-superfamily ATPase, KaiC/GvpD/RAD55 family [Methanolobus profundi]
MQINRIPTGIKELDELLEGGYPLQQGILISGPPGSGKSILATHFLHMSCLAGKKCMLMLTHVNVESYLEQARSIGIDFQTCIDKGTLLITKSFETRSNKIYNAARHGAGIGFLEKDIVQNVQDIPDDVDVVVIDNLDMLSLYHSTEEFADKFFTINDILFGKKCTSLFLMGQEENGMKHTIAQHISFGNIELYMDRETGTGRGIRQMYIPKMRCTYISLEPLNYKITKQGIKIERIFQRDEIIKDALKSVL